MTTGSGAPPRIGDPQRLARLVARQRLGGDAEDVVEAVRAVVALHSSDPVTPHLALWARVEGYRTDDLTRALCEDRSLWRTHAMRRTLFVVPSRDRAVIDGAASRTVADKERRRVERWVAPETGPQEASAWLRALESRVVEALEAAGELSTTELARVVPGLDMRITVGSGRWASEASLSSRVLFLLAMQGRVVRTRPAGTWRSSQYRWAAATGWFDHGDQGLGEPEARARLAASYLARYGPATTTDLRWWTGWTARQSADALSAVGAVEVRLDDGSTGWVLPGDVDDTDPGQRSVALLPGLDPATMGWKSREWFLGDHAARLFDRNGNAGPTAWVGGRVVGGWAQRPDGEVVLGLLESVDDEAREALTGEAAGLGDWLDGTIVSSRFPGPLERELATGSSAQR